MRLDERWVGKVGNLRLAVRILTLLVCDRSLCVTSKNALAGLWSHEGGARRLYTIGWQLGVDGYRIVSTRLLGSVVMRPRAGRSVLGSCEAASGTKTDPATFTFFHSPALEVDLHRAMLQSHVLRGDRFHWWRKHSLLYSSLLVKICDYTKSYIDNNRQQPSGWHCPWLLTCIGLSPTQPDVASPEHPCVIPTRTMGIHAFMFFK